MIRNIPIFASLLLSAGLLSACDKTQNPDPGVPAENQSAPQASSPATGQSSQAAPHPTSPQPQQLSLYIIPLNPADFSMENIQSNKKKIEEEPENVEALIALGNANFMIQRFEITRDLLDRAIKVDPKQLEARLTLSSAHLFLQDVDSSLKQLDELLALQGDHPEALYNKGLIQLQSTGDRTAAKGTWTKLVQAHPDHSLARQVQPVLGQL
ncbi:MAG TPA: tetratricopeptide repeat protein [Nitrospiria bacterium]|nr:tetratricopeptide repeat protein [Nitrospiria bacterium]